MRRRPGSRYAGRAVIWVGFVKLVALAYATLHSVRARYGVGVAAVGVMAYVAVAALAAAAGIWMPFGDALRTHWWLSLGLMPPLSFTSMALAWRQRRALPAIDPRSERLDRAALAFLANGLLDAGLLVLVAAGALLMARD